MNTIEFADKGPSEIPDWAIRQRHLIDTMNQAAPIYQKRYTNDDGTFTLLDLLTSENVTLIPSSSNKGNSCLLKPLLSLTSCCISK